MSHTPTNTPPTAATSPDALAAAVNKFIGKFLEEWGEEPSYRKVAEFTRDHVLTSDPIVVAMAEALESWVAYEKEQIAKDGPYVSLKIPEFIAKADAALTRYRSAFSLEPK